MAPPSPQETWCGGVITTRRGLLASLWTVVMILTALAFLTAMFFSISARRDDYGQGAGGGGGGDQEQDNAMIQEPEIAVTSRAMAFVALWTAVLASLVSIFGTVILGWQSPTGQYYTCCSSNVFRTTPLGIGSFIGTLLMFSNLTLVCAVLFGEFQIRDFQRDAAEQNGKRPRYTAVERSSVAFSIMCMFLTVLYASFAALTYVFSKSVLDEHESDVRDEVSGGSGRLGKILHYNGYDGYIGERFDVRRTPANVGYVSNPTEGIV